MPERIDTTGEGRFMATDTVERASTKSVAVYAYIVVRLGDGWEHPVRAVFATELQALEWITVHSDQYQHPYDTSIQYAVMRTVVHPSVICQPVF